MDRIIMAHGSGGEMTAALIKEIFEENYGNELMNSYEDAAVINTAELNAFTTDSFVVYPPAFPGGNIGRLAVCGTVNDLAAMGAKPEYMTAGFILEEGLEIEELKKYAKSMAEAAAEAGIKIVAGDTKVTEGKGGLYINTSGIGRIKKKVGTKFVKPGDAIILTGDLGDHHAALLGCRLDIKNNIVSDAAPLNGITEALIDSGFNVHVMRDVTRGGLATVLKEMSSSSGLFFEIDEEKIPVSREVKGFAGLLGLDVLYMGNEGKMVIILPDGEAAAAVKTIKESRYGKNACVIGRVSAPSEADDAGKAVIKTGLGLTRELMLLSGEGLPRIC